MNTNTLRDATKQLADDGFVVLPDMCSGRLIDRIFGIAKQRGAAVREALGDREIGIGSAAGYAEIVQRSPGRWDVPISPAEFGVDDRQLPWWPLVARVLGDDAEHSFSGVVFSEPGSPAQCWHTDSPHIDSQHLPPHALNVMVALHDIVMAMGPTQCARGSHRLTNHLKNRSLVREELIYQHASTSPDGLVRNTDVPVPERVTPELTKGSCLVTDDRILHRGLGNRSQHARHLAYFSYRKGGYSENTHFEAQRSLFGTND